MPALQSHLNTDIRNQYFQKGDSDHGDRCILRIIRHQYGHLRFSRELNNRKKGYDAAKDTFTPAPGVTVPEGYVKSRQQAINGMFSNSRLILEQDYYRKLGLRHSE